MRQLRLIQTLRYCFYNLRVDFCDAGVAFDYDDTHMLSGCDFTVLVVDACEEIEFLAFEAAFVGAVGGDLGGVAAAGAGKRCL